nr:hypothetical protein [Vulcaniibacterium thermophilum]
MGAADGDVEVAAVLAEAGRDMVADRKQVALLVLRADLERAQGGSRQPAVVVLGAGGDRIEQQGGLQGLPRRHQRRAVGVFDAGDEAFGVPAVAGFVRIANAALLDHPQQRRHLLCAAAESNADYPDLRLRIFPQPGFRLHAQLEIRRFHALVEGMGEAPVPEPFGRSQHAVLGERAFDIAAGDVCDARGFQVADLLVDPGDRAPVLGLVVVQTVAGAVERGDEQALVRVVAAHEHRHAKLLQRGVRASIAVQIVPIGGIGVAARGPSDGAHVLASVLSRSG